ncbi:hypothetical protein [Nonomuraea wenchangensis]|nr:hypothetical protein [Nonomuraea wenchangensis]
MRGPWRASRGSIAPTGVMALVVLSLVALSLLPAGVVGWAGGSSSAHAAAAPVWTANDLDADPEGLPPQGNNVCENHVLSLWPPLRGTSHNTLAHLALTPSPGSDADAVRDPQQLAHRTAGSRSPPAA